MKCPNCSHVFKDPSKVKGGAVSKRNLSKEDAKKMQQKSVETRRKNKAEKTPVD